MTPFRRLRYRLGFVKPRPRKLDAAKRQEIGRRYFRERVTQRQLSFEFNVSQSTVARVVAAWESR